MYIKIRAENIKRTIPVLRMYIIDMKRVSYIVRRICSEPRCCTVTKYNDTVNTIKTSSSPSSYIVTVNCLLA